MTKSINHQFFYPHPPEVVWEYLTKSEYISQWLMENDFQPILGHDFQFKTTPMPNFGFDGNIYCKVLEIVPFKKLSYSWKGGPGNGIINLDSIVYWTLHPTEQGTELQLVHTGFKETDEMMFTIMNDGWSKIIQKILKVINDSIHGNSKA